MPLNPFVEKSLRAFSYGNDGAREGHQAEQRLDLQKKMSFATAIVEGVTNGTVPQAEAAQALKNLGPQFADALTITGNAPPAALTEQGGGPPTTEQSEAQRTTIFGEEPKDPLANELVKLQTQRDTLNTAMEKASPRQKTNLDKQVAEIDARIAKITTITGRTEQDVLTKNQVGKSKLAADKGATNVGRIGQILGELSDAPRAIGIPGLVSENIGGLLGQIPGAGPDMEEAFSKAVTGLGAEESKRMRSAFIDTSAAMLSAITGEESGRYTEAERELANKALGALRTTSTVTQARAGFKRAMEITLAAQRRDAKNAGQEVESLTTREGITALGNRLTGTGMSEEDAKDVIRELIRIEGFL